MQRNTALLCLLTATAAFGGVVKGPYVQNVTRDSITIMWETGEPCVGTVRYGETSLSEPEPRRIHEIRLTGLQPETEYSYQVVACGVASALYSLRTAPRAGSPIRFAYYGDNKSGPAMHKRVANRVLAAKPGIAFHGGDMVDEGDRHSQWRKLFFDPARNLMHSVPLYPAQGNHERNAGHFFSHFSLPGNESWYSLDYGDAHFTVLNSNEGILEPDSPQLAWLLADLEAAKTTWKFVFVHHPPFTSGGNHYTSRRVELKNMLHPVFAKYGVDMVFNGHDHNYERTLPIGGAPGQRPVTYVVSGNGGTPLRYVGRKKWTAFASRVFGYTIVRVDGRRLEMDAYNVDGDRIDRISIDKGDPARDREYLASALAFDSIEDPVDAIKLFKKGERLLERAPQPVSREILTEALDLFARAYAEDSGFADALVEQAKVNRKLGNESLAIEQLKRAAEQMPSFPDSYEELTDLHRSAGRYDEAARSALAWVHVEPDDAKPLQVLARVLVKQKATDAAVGVLKRALDILPSDADTHIALAKLYEERKATEDALRHYREALAWIDEEAPEDRGKVEERIRALAGL